MALTKVTNSMLVQPVNHNILINPSFTVKQRGDVVDGGAGAFYGLDRWKSRGLDGVGGTMVQCTTAIDSTTGINKLVVKHRGSAQFPITDAPYVYQNIEAVNVLGLYGKDMTFSFSYSDTGGSGIPKVRVGSYDSSDTFKTLFDAVPTSLGNNRWACTFTLSTTDGTFLNLNETGLQVLIYANEQNTAPAEWSVWETKLEVGSGATPFIARPYGEELALCQRYYQVGTYFGNGGADAGSTSPTVSWPPLVQMRTPASVVMRDDAGTVNRYTDAAGTSVSWGNGGFSHRSDNTGFTGSYASDFDSGQFVFDVGNASKGLVSWIRFHWKAEAEL